MALDDGLVAVGLAGLQHLLVVEPRADLQQVPLQVLALGPSSAGLGVRPGFGRARGSGFRVGRVSARSVKKGKCGRTGGKRGGAMRGRLEKIAGLD